MSERSTAYIFGFSTAVCLGCAVLVSGSVVALKERQEANKVIDKQSNVLAVAGLVEAGEKIEPAQVSEIFGSSIRPLVVDLATGQVVSDVDATTYDQGAAAKNPELSREAEENPAKVLRVPNRGLVYQVIRDDKVEKLILPIEGKGLWSTLYGFLALEGDGNTISGITFYKHGETPGLGGEVDNPSWKAVWKGRKAFDDKGKPVITVIKGAAGPASVAPHKVDGLSGATLTANGVTYLVQFWLGDQGFGKYLENFRNGKEAG